MDAIELLTSQHHTLEALVKTVLAWPDDDVRRQRLQRLADAVMLHMLAEEAVLYPALWPDTTGLPEGSDSAREARREARQEAHRAAQEHAFMKRQMAGLLAMSPSAPAFERSLMALKALLQAHHVDEETRLFPLARQRVSALRRNELGMQIEQVQLQLLRQGPLHADSGPAAPAAPRAATVAAS